MAAKYRKKPVVIEAMQNDGGSQFLLDLGAWMGSEWDGANGPEGEVYITTLEGVMRGDVGDWIIKGVKGEFYPVKDAIFQETYEAVVDDAPR